MRKIKRRIRKKRMRAMLCGLALTIAVGSGLPGMAAAEENDAAAGTEATAAADAQPAEGGEQAPAADQKASTAADKTESELTIPAAKVEVHANRDQLTIGQQPDAEGINNYVITHSSAGSKSDMASKDLPQTITAVGQKVLKEQHVTTIDEALANIAGVFPARSPDYWALSGPGRYTIRGFGVTSDAPFYVNGLWDTDSTMSRWTGNLDRIEVLKGPASVLYGNGSPGGLVNFMTKKPLPYESFTFGTDFLSWGGRSQDMDMSLPLTKDKKWLSRMIIQNADYRAWQRRFGQISYKRFDSSVVIQGQSRPDTTYTFELGYHHHYGLDPANIFLPREVIGLVPYDTYYVNPAAKGYYIGRNIQARVDHKFNNIWTIHSAIGYSNRSTLTNYQFGSGVDLKKGTIGQWWTNKLGQSNTRSWDTTANGKFTAWGLKHDLTLGYTWSYNKFGAPWCTYLQGRDLPGLDIYNPVFTSPEAYRNKWRSWNRNNWNPDTEHRYGTYMSDIVELSPKVKLAAGTSFTRDKKNNAQYNSFGRTWRLGATYEAAPGRTWFIGRSTYYEPNKTWTNDAGQKFYFKPESGDQVEGGLKVDMNNRASITLAAYRINRTNLPFTIPDTEPEIYATIGKETSKGIDLDVSYIIRPGWNMLLAYSYCNARIVKADYYESGSRIPNVPLQAVKLWSTYEIQNGRWQGLGFGGGLTHVGKRALSYDSKYGNLDGHTIFDAVVYYKKGDWRYSLNAYNITNRKYWSYGNTSSAQAGDPLHFILRIERTFS